MLHTSNFIFCISSVWRMTPWRQYAHGVFLSMCYLSAPAKNLILALVNARQTYLRQTECSAIERGNERHLLD